MTDLWTRWRLWRIKRQWLKAFARDPRPVPLCPTCNAPWHPIEAARKEHTDG